MPGDRFVIVRDSDGRDCHAIKERIVDSCKEIGRDNVLVRIEYLELEGRYLGDFVALSEAYDSPQVLRHQAKVRFWNPDSVRKPSDEVATWAGPFGKTEAARRLGSWADVKRNWPQGFQVFVEGVQRPIAEPE